MTIKVKMHPHPGGVKGPSGIDQVVLAYAKHLPNFGVEIVHPQDEHFDLVAGHVGTGATLDHPFVCHIHGLHWTADYPCEKWQYAVNKTVIESVRMANEVTVPSQWVAEPFQRDMRFTPHVIPHGIDVAEWEHDALVGDYVLWNKNRDHDVCDMAGVMALAQRFPRQHFVTTFMPRGAQPLSNVNRIGKIPHDQMKQLVQSAFVYLSVVKETFGIGVLEAMAAGVPVLGFDFGGNSLLIEHGRNGYLARPGDFDDLAKGLQFCAKYRDELGANGREMARAWTWESAVEKVAGVYRLALEPEPPTVAVVIPHYNIGIKKLTRAVESARAQNVSSKVLSSIIVVDDGSTNSGQIETGVRQIGDGDDRITYVQQPNRGVARARNAGISCARTKYICCLDADDAIAPEFIETCVRALEADRSLGIAYTGLWEIRPDGRESLSKWPSDWNFDAHLKKHNQVPTCCVFRREMWERLGGYKSRYCPSGAGEEDAELWLRAGAYGYKAKKVTNKGLFVYSHKSGQVSGNPQHEVTDWTACHPWAGKDGDGKHPFASYATPERFAHEVRQHDQPTISVVIPVGAGHEDKVVSALDWLEAQTFRGWEAIVVWDTPDNPDIYKAYPYIKSVMAYTSVFENEQEIIEPVGAGAARNRGAEIARAPLLVFLDADDWLYPTALEKMLYAWNEHQEIIYTDYTSKAIVKTEYMREIESKNRLHAVLKSFGADGEEWHEIVYKSKSFDYECERAQRQPEQDEKGNYYVWCNVTTLIPRAWHDEVGGFDEELESWEDVDYNWRLAKAGKCYYRIEQELLVYNFHMGHRRESGRQNHKKLLYYLVEKHKELETVMCRGCGSNNRPSPLRGSGVFAAQETTKALAGVDDNDFVLCWYIHGNTGNHQVTGAALHDKEIPGFTMIPKRSSPPGWAINYGYFGGGRKTKRPVHKKDLAAQPHLWEVIEERQAVGVPEVEKVPLPAPEPLSVAKEVHTQSGQVVAVRETPEISAIDMGEHSMPPRARDFGQTLASGIQPDAVEDSTQPDIPVQAIDLENVISGKVEQPPVFELQKIPGVNVKIAEGLVAAGCRNKADVAALGVDRLMLIKGVGDVKARMIFGAVSGG